MKVDKSKWKRCKLIDVCKTYQPKTIAVKSLCPSGDFFVYGANGIIGKHVEYNHDSPEVIVGCRGTCGVVHITQPKAWINGNAMVIHPTDPTMFNIKFLYYLVRSVDYSKVITGVAQPQITRANLSKITIDIPSLEDQCIIASELDALQEVIDGYREQIADLDALAQSIFLDTFGDPITNPKDWEIKRLDEVCDSQLGKMINQQTQTGELKPFLCAVNVLDNDFYVGEIKKFRIKTDEEEKYRVLPGDLMICEGGDAGRCAIWNKDFEIYYQKSVHRVRSSQLSMQYLMFVFRIYKQQGVLAEKSKGATIQHLTKKSLNQLLIMLPPITLQNLFSEQFVAIEDKKELLRQQLADAEMLMAERMQYYFS